MKWIKNNFEDGRELPKDGRDFLALWKGRICIAAFDEDMGRFYICFDPISGVSCRVSQDRERKFTHWAKLEYPEDYLAIKII